MNWFQGLRMCVLSSRPRVLSPLHWTKQTADGGEVREHSFFVVLLLQPDRIEDGAASLDAHQYDSSASHPVITGTVTSHLSKHSRLSNQVLQWSLKAPTPSNLWRAGWYLLFVDAPQIGFYHFQLHTRTVVHLQWEDFWWCSKEESFQESEGSPVWFNGGGMSRCKRAPSPWSMN